MSIDRQQDGTALAKSAGTVSEAHTTSHGRPPLQVVDGSTTGDVGWRHASLGRLDRRYVRYKYGIERVVGCLLFVVALPAMVVIAALIRARLGPGILYTQDRVGRDGRTFRIIKFRTMDTDRRSNEIQFVGGERRTTHKTDLDPRHTRLGTLLRNTSLDELPQLWNVVRGEMVLVGPRPELLSVVQCHRLQTHPRHRMKPGITGLWQVSEYRNELLHEHMDVDIDYIETVSLRTDLGIMLRTLSMPFDRNGR